MKHGNFGKALCLTGIAVASICLAASYLSRFWIEFDVLGHFTWHFILTIISCAIACFVSGPLRVPVALAAMATGMIAIGSWGKLGPDQLQAEANMPTGARVLNIMHFNIWGRNRQLKEVDAEIRRLDPDIVFLTEMRKSGQGLKVVLGERFQFRLPQYNDPSTPLLMYSKYPFAAQEMQHRRGGLSVIRGTLGPEWHNLNIIGTHLSRPTDVSGQEKDAHDIGKLIEKLNGATVVVGDFNATPHSAILDLFRSRTGLRRVTNLPTWPATGPNLPQFAIDHIFISDGLKLSGPAIVGRDAGSDHLPIAASIVVPQAN